MPKPTTPGAGNPEDAADKVWEKIGDAISQAFKDKSVNTAHMIGILINHACTGAAHSCGTIDEAEKVIRYVVREQFENFRTNGPHLS